MSADGQAPSDSFSVQAMHSRPSLGSRDPSAASTFVQSHIPYPTNLQQPRTFSPTHPPLSLSQKMTGDSYIYAPKNLDPYQPSIHPSVSIDTYLTGKDVNLQHVHQAIPHPNAYPSKAHVFPFPDYRGKTRHLRATQTSSIQLTADPLASPASEQSDEGSSSSEDRWSWPSPLTSPLSRSGSGDRFVKQETEAMLLQPPNTPQHATQQDRTLLDDYDPTPRPFTLAPVDAFQIPSHPPSRNGSYSSLSNISFYGSDRYQASPSASFVSLPPSEVSSPDQDYTLRHNMQSVHFADVRGNAPINPLTQSHNSWQAPQNLTASQLEGRTQLSQSQSEWKASELNASQPADRRLSVAPYQVKASAKRSRRNTESSTDEPMHWASQTTSATKLAAIARRKPGTDAKFVCPYCNETFTRNYNLNGHIRAHKGERPFQCPSCPKAFARAHDLRRHQELHVAAPIKHTCDTCGKSFKRPEGLQKHAEHCLDLGIDPTPRLTSQSSEGDLASGVVLPASPSTSHNASYQVPTAATQRRAFTQYQFAYENPAAQYGPQAQNNALRTSTSSATSAFANED